MTKKLNDSSSIPAHETIEPATQRQIDLIRDQALQRAAVGMLSDDEEMFVSWCRNHYERASEYLPADVQSRLSTQRHRVVDALSVRDKRHHFLSSYMPMATAAVLFLAVAVYTQQPPSFNAEFSTEEIQSMAVSEDFELYEELEFYQWLQDEDFFS